MEFVIPNLIRDLRKTSRNQNNKCLQKKTKKTVCFSGFVPEKLTGLRRYIRNIFPFRGKPPRGKDVSTALHTVYQILKNGYEKNNFPF